MVGIVSVYPILLYIVEMPWGGTWESSKAAFLFLFLLLGVILTRNPLDASLASLSNFFTAILKLHVPIWTQTASLLRPLKNNDSYYITKICPILNIFLII